MSSMIADVLDWGTHPYATAKEEGSTLMLFIYRVQEKNVPSKRKNLHEHGAEKQGAPRLEAVRHWHGAIDGSLKHVDFHNRTMPPGAHAQTQGRAEGPTG